MCLTGHMRNKIKWMICRMITFSEKIFVVKMCNFLCSVSSQQKFEVMSVKALGQTVTALRQIRVTAQFYLENKRKYILEVWGHADPKDMKRRERPLALWLLFLYVFFFLSMGLPYVNWASQECCLFYVKSSFRSLDLPLFYFLGLFPSLPLATTILDSLFLF